MVCERGHIPLCCRWRGSEGLPGGEGFPGGEGSLVRDFLGVYNRAGRRTFCGGLCQEDGGGRRDSIFEER